MFSHNNDDDDRSDNRSIERTEVEFRAERRSLHVGDKRHELHDEHSGGGGHGGNEMGWLVSYADMMTLLFGLFVILFSLMVESPSGNADQVMRDVSKKYFGGTTDLPPDKAPPVVATATPVPAVATPVPSPVPVPSPTATPNPSPAPPTADPHELEAAQDKISGLEKKVSSMEKELKSREEAMKAAKGNPPPSKNEDDSRVASLEKTNKQLQSHAEEVEQKLTAEMAKNEALQKDLEKKQSKAPTQNYMATMLVWDTEKHDLDLVIEDPSGKHFDFKHRKFASNPGHFELDSRYGPGIEMWKAENFSAGTYKAVVKLYSQNGNDKPAKGHVTIVTNLSTYQSPPIELVAPGDKKEITFKVDATGAVEFGK